MGDKENPLSVDNLDPFTRAYLETALWSSTDNGYFGEGDERNNKAGEENGGDPLDDNFTIDDFAPDAIELAVADCNNFRAYCSALGLDWTDRVTEERAGHDYWLTRNGHGAGFWDEGLGALGDDLTAAAKTFGGSDCTVGDDGLIHLS